MGHIMRPDQPRRWLPVVAALVVAAAMIAPASAAVEDVDTPRVENLAVSEIGTAGGRNVVRITWDPPDVALDWDDDVEYRVLYSHDWRPQRSIQKLTEREEVLLRNLKPGRVYTVTVQADIGDGWGQPATDTFVTPGASDVPWVVSIGDSFISGEGGRWAGNTDVLPNFRSETDTGERAYYDDVDGETIPECHRSHSALIHIGTARSMNFACSGAITTSAYDGTYWKPGIDRVERPDIDLGEFGPALGQAELLKRFAEEHEVKMVVLSIGGNNFFFSDIVTTCAKAYLFSREVNPTLCSQDQRLAIYMTETWQDKVRAEIKTAILEVIWAMRAAGYEDREWTLVQHLYPRPIATSDLMRYPESRLPILNYRQTRGGCGMWDADANWAVRDVLRTVNETAQEAAREALRLQPTARIVQMETSDAFKGHELCNKYVYRVNSWNSEDAKGVSHWRHPKAADRSEWMKEIDVSNVTAATKNESFHPGFWGQLALRNCLRQLWNQGSITTGGRCTATSGVNARGEPRAEFTPDRALTLLP